MSVGEYLWRYQCIEFVCLCVGLYCTRTTRYISYSGAYVDSIYDEGRMNVHASPDIASLSKARRMMYLYSFWSSGYKLPVGELPTWGRIYGGCAEQSGHGEVGFPLRLMISSIGHYSIHVLALLYQVTDLWMTRVCLLKAVKKQERRVYLLSHSRDNDGPFDQSTTGTSNISNTKDFCLD